MPRGSSCSVGALIVVLSAAAGGAAAEAGGGEAPWTPPVLTFPGEGIGLLEAVRLTLEHEPNLRLADQATRLQAGVAQEQRGLFDPVIGGSLSYEFTQQELRRSAVKAEADRRQAFQDVIDAVDPEADRAEAVLAHLEAIEEAIANGDPLPVLTDPELQEAFAGIQAQIDLINNLIENATDPAQERVLTELRDRTIDRGRQIFADLATNLRGQVVNAETSLRNLGAVPDAEESTLGLVDLRYSQLFRSGVGISPFVSGSYESTRYQDKPVDSDFGGLGIEDLYQVIVGFTVSVPLARGRGAESVAAFERAAEIDLEASRAALRHAASASVLGTALAYWDLVAAQRQVEVAARSAELQGELVAISRELIAGDQIPAAELARAQAGEANAQARLEDSRRALHEARQGLARAIGLAVEDEASAPLAADPFPPPPASADPAAAAGELARGAIERRFDLAAARSLVASGKVLVEAARRDRRPRVDLDAEVSTSATGEKSLSEAVDRWVGPSGRLGVAVEKPIANNAARGRLVQSTASHNQRLIGAADLERGIRLNVVAVSHALSEAIDRRRQAAAAVGYYEETVAAEVERYRAGASTLVDTVLTEEQKTAALFGLIDAERQYASLLARLRFEAGLLVTQREETSLVTPENLLALPGGEG